MYKCTYLHTSTAEAAAQTVFVVWLWACSSAWGQEKVTVCYDRGNELLVSVK
jgi:hypothetical protein